MSVSAVLLILLFSSGVIKLPAFRFLTKAPEKRAVFLRGNETPLPANRETGRGQ